MKTDVYRLIDPRNGETFYVGRGKGNRVFSHIRADPLHSGGRNCPVAQFVIEIEGPTLKSCYIIKLGEQIVWREPASWEDWERFNELKVLLRDGTVLGSQP